MTVMTQELVDKVLELRKLTGAPAMICRKALSRTEWDLEKAKKYVDDLDDKYPTMLITPRSPLHGS